MKKVQVKTKLGLIFKINMSDVSNSLSNGEKIINLRPKDKVVEIKTIN